MRSISISSCGEVIDLLYVSNEVRDLVIKDLAPPYRIEEGNSNRRPSICVSEVDDINQLLNKAKRKVELQHNKVKEIYLRKPANSPNLVRKASEQIFEDGSRLISSQDESGIVVYLDQDGKNIEIGSHGPRREIAAEIRRVVRDQVVISKLESKGAVTVHSALLVNGDGLGVLIVGTQGAGKTSFFLTALAQPGWTSISCERNTIWLENGLLRCLPSPEKISFFPGILYQFEETRNFSKKTEEEFTWKRSEKFHIHWRDILDRFGKPVPNEPIEIKSIVFPRYGEDFICMRNDNFPVDIFRPEIQTGCKQPHPNWLKKYVRNEAAAEKTITQLMKLTSFNVLWATPKDISKALENVSRFY